METVTDKEMRKQMEKDEVGHNYIHQVPEMVGHHHVRTLYPYVSFTHTPFDKIINNSSESFL